MPIVMVFSSVPILSADGTEFTEGNAATSGTPNGDDLAFLRRIPFEKVYHDSAFSASERASIVYRRCAEVLVPIELDLTNLKRLVCRSQAEHETLLNMLSERARNVYATQIGVAANAHHKRWTFVESVDLSNERVIIRFSPTTRSPGPFDARVVFTNAAGVQIGHWEGHEYMANGTLKFNLGSIGNPTSYGIKVTLDGNLAYRGRYKAKEELL
jgi:ssDNA thymidine ADP-ribosyltransferase, DarT